MTDEVRLEPSPNDKKVMLAGDPQKLTANKRMNEGIPLDSVTYKEFQKLSKEFSVPLSLIK